MRESNDVKPSSAVIFRLSPFVFHLFLLCIIYRMSVASSYFAICLGIRYFFLSLAHSQHTFE